MQKGFLFPFLQGRLRTLPEDGWVKESSSFHSFKVGFVRQYDIDWNGS